jgi:head-tail adaptor
MMATGKFDRLVTIVTPAEPTTTDAWNEATGPAPTRIDTWAAVRTAPGTERFQSAENLALAPIRFFFRWRGGLVQPTSLIEYDGLVYDVKSVEEMDRRKLLQVVAIARVAPAEASP